MNTQLIDKAISALQHIKKDIESIPDETSFREMRNVLDLWDYRYKLWCSEMDEEYGEEEGTHYNSEDGLSLEYYVEADEVHELLKAYKQLLLRIENNVSQSN